MPYGDGFYLTFNFPSGTDHTGRTMEFTIRNKKTKKSFSLTGPNTQITVASEVIDIAAPSATTDGSGVAMSDIESVDDNSEYGFKVLDSGGLLVARFQGEIAWAPAVGLFNES